MTNTQSRLSKHSGLIVLVGTCLFAGLISVLTIFSNNNLSTQQKLTDSTMTSPLKNDQDSTSVLGSQNKPSDAYLLSVKLTSPTDGQLPQQTNFVRVRVRVDLTNTSQATIQISPLLDMKLATTDGKTHPMTAEFLGDKVIGGPIEPGQTFSDNIDFTIPKDDVIDSFIYSNGELGTSEKIKLL